jgi:hypothetical protein
LALQEQFARQVFHAIPEGPLQVTAEDFGKVLDFQKGGSHRFSQKIVVNPFLEISAKNFSLKESGSKPGKSLFLYVII